MHVASVRAFSHGRSRRPVRIIPKCKERIKFVEPFKSHYAPSSASLCNRASDPSSIRYLSLSLFLPTNFATFENLYLPTAGTETYGIMERSVRRRCNDTTRRSRRTRVRKGGEEDGWGGVR